MSETCINHIENYWQTLVIKGKEYNSQNDYTKALEFFNNALYRAEVLYNNINFCEKLDIPVVKIYLNSCYNLIKVYHKLNDYNECNEVYKKVCTFLLMASKNKLLNQDEIQNEIKKLSYSYNKYLKLNYSSQDE